jgi:hypothetical protein
MIVTEDIINQILREIDVMYYSESVITAEEAEDLCECVIWIVGKSLNESNIQYVVGSLRGFKSVIDEKEVSRVIKTFKKILGSYMH